MSENSKHCPSQFTRAQDKVFNFLSNKTTKKLQILAGETRMFYMFDLNNEQTIKIVVYYSFVG